MPHGFKKFLTISLLMICVGSHSSTLLPAGLTNDETNIFKIFGMENQAMANWNKLKIFEQAKENFSRASLLARCKNTYRNQPNQFYFDVSLRSDMNLVAEKILEGKIGPARTLENFRYVNRRILWSLQKISPTEKDRLFSVLNGPDGEKTLNQFRTLLVFEQYDDIHIDSYSGTEIVYPIIELKEFLHASGQYEVLNSALKKHLPALAEKFEKIPPANLTSSRDIVFLEGIKNDFNENLSNIMQWFVEETPKPQQMRLANFMENKFFATLEKIMETRSEETISAMSPTAGKNSRVSPILSDLNKKFPEPEDLRSEAFKMSPAKWVDNVHLKYCDQQKK